MKYNALLLAAIFLLVRCGNNASNNQHADHQKDADTTKMVKPSTMSSLMDDMMNDMHAVQTTGNADKDFAALMKAHHQGAVEMAKLELAGGKDSAMINMASVILRDQMREIDQFNQFLASGKTEVGKSDAFYNESMENMHKMHDGIEESGSTDMQFVRGMIPHHQGAVDMATVYLKYARDEGLKKLAQEIIAAQKKEILLFQNWLKAQMAQGTE